MGQALDEYRRVITGTGTIVDAASRLAMGRLAEAAGRWRDARDWYILARNADPGASDAAGTKEWLKVIGGPKPDAPSASASVTRQRPAGE